MDQPSDPAPQFTTMGRIGAAYGIRGWVKLISFTDPPGNILNYRHFSLSPPGIFGSRAGAGNLEQIEIDESRALGKGFVGHIRGCDDRDQTRRYTGRELKVERSLLPALEAGDYYWFQLQGLEVINLQEENLGRVHHLMETGANDVLVVRADGNRADGGSGSGGSTGKEEKLIPYIKERVVKQVDLEQGIIRVDWEKDY